MTTASAPDRSATAVLIPALGVVALLLLALFPLLSLFTQNQTDVDISVIWWPIFVCIGSSIVVYVLLLLVTKQPLKTAALASVVVFGVWYYGIFSDKLSGSLGSAGFTVAWFVLLAALAFAIARTRRKLGNLILILAAGAAALAIPQIVSLVSYQANHTSPGVRDPRWWPTSLAAPPHASGAPGAKTPDIYVLIPDDYARPDVLRRYFKYYDAAFLAALKQRGFVVSPQARSPYSDSESNTAAELNLDYLSQFPKLLGAKSQDVRPVKRAEEDNRAARLLAPLGYRYVHLDTDEVTFGGSNPSISPVAPPDSFANLWLQKSVLRLIGGPFGFSQTARNDRFRSSIASQFQRLSQVPAQPGRKLVVFHTLLPHDPYVTGAAGQPVSYVTHSDQDLASTAGRRHYLNQLKGLNRRLLAAIDSIISRSKAPPVIVIQSDEGFQANPETWGEGVMQQLRVKGLLALRLPGRAATAVPTPPNTVNTLRFVFNRYLGTHYPMLPTASYPEGDYPYQYEPMRVR